MTHNIICPFFGYKKRCSIGCEGRPPKSFRSAEDCMTFIKLSGCCTFEYATKCAHAKKMQKMYDNRDNK